MKNAATQSLNFQPDKYSTSPNHFGNIIIKFTISLLIDHLCILLSYRWDQQMRAKRLFFIVLIAHIHLLRTEHPDVGAFKTDLHRARVRWNSLKMKCLEGFYIVWLTAQNEQPIVDSWENSHFWTLQFSFQDCIFHLEKIG